MKNAQKEIMLLIIYGDNYCKNKSKGDLASAS